MLLYLDQAWDKFRAAGRMNSMNDLHAAIIEGAVQRIRPKIMTTCAILFGLLPIMLVAGHSIGCRRDEAHCRPHDWRCGHVRYFTTVALSRDLQLMAQPVLANSAQFFKHRGCTPCDRQSDSVKRADES